ncbi:MAG: chemotaxis protein CheW [Lautropia sp.]
MSSSTVEKQGHAKAVGSKPAPDGEQGGAAIARTAASAARLGIAIGPERLLIDLSEAGEIVPLPPVIVPVPLTRDWLHGITNLRGSLFTVVDLRRFALGLATETGKESRILALTPALDFNVTIVVSRMLGLRNTASMKPLPAPGAAGEAAASQFADLVGRPWLGPCHIDAEGQRWRELSLSRLIRDPAFLSVARNDLRG